MARMSATPRETLKLKKDDWNLPFLCRQSSQRSVRYRGRDTTETRSKVHSWTQRRSQVILLVWDVHTPIAVSAFY